MTRLCTVIASTLIVLTPAFVAEAKNAPKVKTMTHEEQVKRGEYLVTIVGCNDCHTPHVMGPHGPEMDQSRLLSGHPETRDPNAPMSWAYCANDSSTAWIGSWGTTFTRNLTPDKATGIGLWTEKDFLDTLRTGRRMGKGRHLREPMPWRWFSQMTDQDIKSIYAYLKTVKPINNHVPDPLPPFVASPAGAAALDAPAEPPAPAAENDAANSTPMTRSQMVARGKYLVTIVGCNDCHTPHKVGTEGPEMDRRLMLSGHPESRDPNKPPTWAVCSAASYTAWNGPWGTSFTRNLTPDEETGIGKWTEQNFIDTMRTGRRMGKGRHLLEPMPWRWFAQMTDEDLKSIYAYLRTVKPVRNHVPEPRPPQTVPASTPGQQ